MTIDLFRTPQQLAPRHSVILLVALLSMTLLASAQNPTGALRGEVQDQSGARVSGAQITLGSSGSSVRREALADNRGEFRIEGLLPGSYHVAVTAKGFAEAASDIEI